MSASRFWKVLVLAAATILSTTAFAASAIAALPEATTGEATNVTSTRVTLHGTVAFTGNETLYAFFAYPAGKSCEPCYESEVKTLSGESPQQVTATLKGLDPETTYEYLVAALDLSSGGYSEGDPLEFVTGSRHATQFEAGEYPAQIAGDQDVENEFGLEGGPSFKCDSADLSGSMAEAAQDLALPADYSGCKAGSLEASIEMNSCNYTVSLDGGGPPYTAGYGVECGEEGDAIEALIYNGSGEKVVCPVSIPAQAAGEALNVTGSGEGASGTVNVEGTVTGVKYTTPGTFGCQLVGFQEAGENGFLEVDASLEAQDGGESVGLSVTGGEADSGLFVSGEESEEPAGQPHFNAEIYPTQITGDQDVENEFGLEGGPSFKCDSAELSGSMAEAAQDLALSADYSGCKIGSLTASIEMNSCSYTVSLDNSGPPYTAGYGVECSEEGDAIEALIYNGSGEKLMCPVSIPPQAAGEALNVTGSGQGASGTVHVEGTANGVKYTTPKQVGCQIIGFKEAGENGFFEVSTSLYGIFPG